MAASKGKKMEKTEPVREARVELLTVRVASWRLRISALTQRPSPVPLVPLVVTKGSKMRSRVAGSMPWPVSAMETRMPGAGQGVSGWAAARVMRGRAGGVECVADEVGEDLAEFVRRDRGEARYRGSRGRSGRQMLDAALVEGDGGLEDGGEAFGDGACGLAMEA